MWLNCNIAVVIGNWKMLCFLLHLLHRIWTVYEDTRCISVRRWYTFHDDVYCYFRQICHYFCNFVKLGNIEDSITRANAYFHLANLDQSCRLFACDLSDDIVPRSRTRIMAARHRGMATRHFRRAYRDLSSLIQQSLSHRAHLWRSVGWYLSESGWTVTGSGE